MFKKTITYIDYNEEERTEDFYFNINEAELAEMELTEEGGMSNLVQKIINTKDMPSLIKIFKKLILAAYGEKSADGKYFMKSKEISERFTCSPAYSKLFMELATNDKLAADFVNNILPKDLADRVQEAQKNRK